MPGVGNHRRDKRRHHKHMEQAEEMTMNDDDKPIGLDESVEEALEEIRKR